MKGAPKAMMAALAAAAWGMADAARVPQDSAAKYYFTTPIAANMIRGTVIGSPPEYRAIRYEDVAWLNEAAAERHALATGQVGDIRRRDVPEFGSWPLSVTNRFKWWQTAVKLEDGAIVTNVIIGWNTTTNTPWTGLPQMGPGAADQFEWTIDTAWLSTDPGILNENRVYLEQHVLLNDFIWPTDTVETEIVDTSGYRLETNVSYVTLPITLPNGSQGESVHTNEWVEKVPDFVTNTVSSIVPKSWRDLLFAEKKLIPYDHAGESLTISAGELLRARKISEAIDLLGGAKRLAVEVDAAGATGVVSTAWVRGQWWSLDPPYPATIGIISNSAGTVRMACNKHAEVWDDYGYSGFVDSSTPSASIRYTLYSSAMPTNAWLAGGVDRTGTAWLYAGIETEYYNDDPGVGATSRRSMYRLGMAQRDGVAVVPVPDGSRTNAYVRYSFTANMHGLLDRAMGETGPSWPTPGDGSVHTLSWSANVVTLMLLIDAEPYAALEDQ